VLSAGETSGDQIGADLARALKARQIRYRTGRHGRSEHAGRRRHPWYGLDELNVMGLSEVLTHLPRLLRLRRQFGQRMSGLAADAFIGIDAPDFNLGLARRVRAEGITAIHYVSPSVWAWRSYRVKRIARSLDLLLTLFPFEPAIYAPHGLDARFVGHHLADELEHAPDQPRPAPALGLPIRTTVIALLPGSRGGELDRHAEPAGRNGCQSFDAGPQARC
jgi:lipid-A-disaccharide synthase